MAGKASEAFTELLRAEAKAIIEEMNRPNPLMELMMEEVRRKQEADQAWLNSLSEHDRRVELTRRRLESLERRWREALDFSRSEDW